MKEAKRGIRQDLLEQLPAELNRNQLSEFSGISQNVLAGWERTGIVTPKLDYHGRNKVRSYDQTQIARALLVRQLKEEGLNLIEIRDEVCKPRWIERNARSIETAISALEMD